MNLINSEKIKFRLTSNIIEKDCSRKDSSMENKYEQVINFFDKSNYLENRFNIEIRKKIIEEISNIDNSYCILDIGCGDGSLFYRLLQKKQSYFY